MSIVPSDAQWISRTPTSSISSPSLRLLPTRQGSLALTYASQTQGIPCGAHTRSANPYLVFDVVAIAGYPLAPISRGVGDTVADAFSDLVHAVADVVEVGRRVVAYVCYLLLDSAVDPVGRGGCRCC